MKKIILILFLFSTSFIFSQEIDFKKGIITVDGKECMKYESSASNVTYQNLNGDDLIILKFIRVNGELYTKVIFVESRQEFTSQNYIFTKKNLVEKLIKSNTLVECALNEEKVNTFVLKYDEKVEERYNKSTTTNTVIIKEEPRKSGVNINLGR